MTTRQNTVRFALLAAILGCMALWAGCSCTPSRASIVWTYTVDPGASATAMGWTNGQSVTTIPAGNGSSSFDGISGAYPTYASAGINGVGVLAFNGSADPLLASSGSSSGIQTALSGDYSYIVTALTSNIGAGLQYIFSWADGSHPSYCRVMWNEEGGGAASGYVLTDRMTTNMEGSSDVGGAASTANSAYYNFGLSGSLYPQVAASNVPVTIGYRKHTVSGIVYEELWIDGKPWAAYQTATGSFPAHPATTTYTGIGGTSASGGTGGIYTYPLTGSVGRVLILNSFQDSADAASYVDPLHTGTNSDWIAAMAGEMTTYGISAIPYIATPQVVIAVEGNSTDRGTIGGGTIDHAGSGIDRAVTLFASRRPDLTIDYRNGAVQGQTLPTMLVRDPAMLDAQLFVPNNAQAPNRIVFCGEGHNLVSSSDTVSNAAAAITYSQGAGNDYEDKWLTYVTARVSNAVRPTAIIQRDINWNLGTTYDSSASPEANVRAHINADMGNWGGAWRTDVISAGVDYRYVQISHLADQIFVGDTDDVHPENNGYKIEASGGIATLTAYAGQYVPGFYDALVSVLPKGPVFPHTLGTSSSNAPGSAYLALHNITRPLAMSQR